MNHNYPSFLHQCTKQTIFEQEQRDGAKRCFVQEQGWVIGSKLGRVINLTIVREINVPLDIILLSLPINHYRLIAKFNFILKTVSNIFQLFQSQIYYLALLFSRQIGLQSLNNVKKMGGENTVNLQLWSIDLLCFQSERWWRLNTQDLFLGDSFHNTVSKYFQK